MSQKDSLAMATSAVQRQQGAGHALPADKATPHEQTQVGIATLACRADPCSWLCRCPVWWPHAESHTMPDIILLYRLGTACASAVFQALMQALNAVACSSRNAMAVQEAQDAAKGTQSAVLKERGSREAARQVEVDAESAALQKPETQEAVKQVQVDAESAQLQKPETQQVALLSLASGSACGLH